MMTARLLGAQPGPRTRIFISYRRVDTAASAAHLHTSLARRFGADKVFRDVVSIEPGVDYAALIEGAIAGTSVFIALIGRRWLTVKGRDGVRRLDTPNDLVRLEVESGLRNAQLVIPVLVDGAEMPTREELPASIAELATHNAFRLSWHEEVSDIGRQVAKVERERAARDAAELAERERLDLTRGSRVPPHSWRSTTATASFNVAIKAMELSLERQGRSVRLASADFWQSMDKLSGRPPDQGFLFDDLVHVIDFVGVKARRGAARYVARSYPVRSLDEAVEQLALGRPVLTGLLITDRWFEEPAATTGRVDLTDPGLVRGGTLGAIVAWDPRLEELRLLTPWPTWGDRGEATLARASAERALTLDEMRSIEAVEMPMRSDG